MFIAISSRYNLCGDKEVFSISKNFKDMFDKLGITLVPVLQTSGLKKICDMCDALILTGSPIHVNPKLYNQENEIGYVAPYEGEDKLDYELIDLFIKKGKPILGICRGIQVLNVYFGGSLIQRISRHEGVTHAVRVEKNSFLSNIYDEEIMVNSTHTQALGAVAQNFRVAATSKDGIIEAIEDKNIWGVQWHPEMLKDKLFFEEFIKKVRLNK